jgi:hypothetical protein
MNGITKENEPRPGHALHAPVDYEDRTCDIAISALDNIEECNGAIVYIKWDKIPQAGGHTVPLLYILFRAGLIPEDPKKLRRLHLAPDGGLRPAHAVCLSRLPSNSLIEGQALRDIIRKGVEDFLRSCGIKTTSIHKPILLDGQITKR